MKTQLLERRRAWRSMSHQDKHERLQDMRRRQQSEVAFEMLRLHVHTR